MLILKIVAWARCTVTAFRSASSKSPAKSCKSSKARFIPRCIAWKKRGWLAATWRESEKGREAKFYRLSAKGRKQLQLEESQWNRLAEAIALILRTAE